MGDSQIGNLYGTLRSEDIDIAVCHCNGII